MSQIEYLKKQAKQLVRLHKDGDYSTASYIRHVLHERFGGLSDREILDREFKLADAQEAVALEQGDKSWAALKSRLADTPAFDVREEPPSLVRASPQLFVTDIRAASSWFERMLGFRTLFLHGEPPFYAQVERDGARLCLRLVDAPLIDNTFREKKQLLSAMIEVRNVKGLYAEFCDRKVDFAVTFTKGPAMDHFIVRTPDGELICFISPPRGAVSAGKD